MTLVKIAPKPSKLREGEISRKQRKDRFEDPGVEVRRAWAIGNPNVSGREGSSVESKPVPRDVSKLVVGGKELSGVEDEHKGKAKSSLCLRCYC